MVSSGPPRLCWKVKELRSLGLIIVPCPLRLYTIPFSSPVCGEPWETQSNGLCLWGQCEVEMQFLESCFSAGISVWGEPWRWGGRVLTQLQTDTHGHNFSIIRMPLETPVPPLLTVLCGVCSDSPLLNILRQLRVTVLKSFRWLSYKFMPSKIHFPACRNSLLA